MTVISAGILLFRRREKNLEFFLVHPGGPFWAKKDESAWSIPKGLVLDGEDPKDAAIREFKEETGVELSGDFRPLTPVKLKSGKVVMAWALEKDIDIPTITSNYFALEWPPGSGKQQNFPEVDKGSWFSEGQAKRMIIKGQVALIDQLSPKKSGLGRKPL